MLFLFFADDSSRHRMKLFVSRRLEEREKEQDTADGTTMVAPSYNVIFLLAFLKINIAIYLMSQITQCL